MGLLLCLYIWTIIGHDVKHAPDGSILCARSHCLLFSPIITVSMTRGSNAAEVIPVIVEFMYVLASRDAYILSLCAVVVLNCFFQTSDDIVCLYHATTRTIGLQAWPSSYVICAKRS